MKSYYILYLLICILVACVDERAYKANVFFDTESKTFKTSDHVVEITDVMLTFYDNTTRSQTCFYENIEQSSFTLPIELCKSIKFADYGRMDYDVYVNLIDGGNYRYQGQINTYTIDTAILYH